MIVALTAGSAAVCLGGWPVAPSDADHHVMTGLDYQEGDTGYFIHQAFDIFAVSPEEDPASPDSIVTAGRSWFRSDSLECDASFYSGLERGCHAPSLDVGCLLTLVAESDFEHRYGHLLCDGYEPDFLADWEDMDDDEEIPEGTTIGSVQRWDWGCPSGSSKVYPTHLHFELYDATSARYVSPSTLFAPYEATDEPVIDEILFVGDDKDYSTARWTLAETSGPPGTCRTVDGDVDLLVRYETRHRLPGVTRHGDNLGARFVRWRACDETEPDCAFADAYDWNSMVGTWAGDNSEVAKAFSVLPGYESADSFVCGDDTFWAIPTNVTSTGGEPTLDHAGAWITPSSGEAVADSRHVTVTLEVEDRSGAMTSKSVPVCVSDPGAKNIPKLLIRDCDDDDATEPSPCDVWSDSPDIESTGPSSIGDASRSLLVCARNVGNAPISLGGSFPTVVPEVDVSVTATRSAPDPSSPPSSIKSLVRSATFPLPTLEKRGGLPSLPMDWGVGEELCARFDWPPADAPDDWAAFDRFEAAVSRAGDTPNTHDSVRYDNNRATRTLHFGLPAMVTGAIRTDVQWPNPPDPTGPLEALLVQIQDTSRPAADGPLVFLAGPQPWTYQLHIGPGVEFTEVAGGVVLGVMSRDDHDRWDARRPLEPGDPGLHPAGRTTEAGARTDSWRIVAIPSGVKTVAVREPRVVDNGGASFFAWPASPESRSYFKAVVRAFAKAAPGRTPVEVYQRVIDPEAAGITVTGSRNLP